MGRRHVRGEGQLPPATGGEPKTTRVFVPRFSLGNWGRCTLPNASRLFGETHIQRVVQWFSARVGGSSMQDVRWVSFTQLYLDYVMCWGNPGPLRVQNQWIDIEMRPYLMVAGFSLRQRLRWFRQMLKAVWKEAACEVGLGQCRPHSSMIQAFVQCASVPWAAHALHTVDNWLAANLSGQCTRNAKALTALPVPQRSLELAV